MPPCLFPTISIHALREEGDFLLSFLPLSRVLFQSTPSARRATVVLSTVGQKTTYFNPRPPRGGRRRSPHATMSFSHYFNPRPPRGGRLVAGDRIRGRRLFQSTPSARRATVSALARASSSFYFNPRPPRGGRPIWQAYQGRSTGFQSTPSARRATGRLFQDFRGRYISIHALREEGDFTTMPSTLAEAQFQSTPSARRATVKSFLQKPLTKHFNPRPPRGGRPAFSRFCACCIKYFNPRPPRGGRPTIEKLYNGEKVFQSTPSARRATREFF